ncbi:class I SAM-dependent methyltransferase [Spongiibacter taiwanensis]|uniref:class I SAM-dependent methyltransferase n=1 Tax=Spongiibacter taiwanensis TaxID=1748242 RepID=UPI002035201F|nr:class I SAM-dependent methyltransferase [Spongiibacter taiwanensis]USA41790.1 class I SAM-dependent methyltransferase [Spongiibacter taiwanensis]
MPKPPCELLAEQAGHLPSAGTALDLACGLGGNALFLASRGLVCEAWDISDTAIHRLTDYTSHRELAISPRCRDALAEPPGHQSFDVIVVSYFLERQLMPAIADALKPGGVLFYQTFVENPCAPQDSINPRFVLKKSELPSHFPQLTLGYYEERQVERASGKQASLALYIGHKPSP